MPAPDVDALDLVLGLGERDLDDRKFWVEGENRWVKMRLTNAGLRLIDKKGLDVVLAEMRARGEKV